MKKILSLLLVACFVFGVMPVTSIALGDASGATPTGAGFFLDLSNEAELDKVAVYAEGGTERAVKGYDADAQAMTYAPRFKAARTTVMEFSASDLGSVDSVAYPVVAMRVKLSSDAMVADAQTIPANIAASTVKMTEAVNNKTYGGYTSAQFGGWTAIQPTVSYDATTEWQTVYIDFSNYLSYGNIGNGKIRSAYFFDNDLASDWNYLRLSLWDYGTAPSSTDAFSVKWIGLFDSIESVYECSGMDYSHVLHFDHAQAVESAVTASSSTLSYDAAENAMKVVSTADTANADVGANVALSTLGVSTIDYPVFAFKVKLGDITRYSSKFQGLASSTRIGWAKAMTDGGLLANTHAQYYTGSTLVRTGKFDYTQTADWQLVFFDYTNLTAPNGKKYWGDSAYEGHWQSFLMNLSAWGQTSAVGDTYYIEWAGLFASTQAAKEYYAATDDADDDDQTGGDQPAGAVSTPVAGSGFFLDLSEEMARNVLAVNTGKTEKGYDSTEQAVTIKPKSDNVKGSTNIEVAPQYLEGVDAVAYPVVAMRVKLSAASMAETGYKAALGGSTEKMTADLATYGGYDADTFGTGADFQGLATPYAATTEWQTIYLDLSNYLSVSGLSKGRTRSPYFFESDLASDWNHLLLGLFQSDYTSAKATDVFSVKWIGLFDSVQSVHKYSNMVYDRVLKFDNSDTAKAGAVGDYTITGVKADVSYDATQNAMKVVSNETQSNGMGITIAATKLSVSTVEYPILAYKIKLGSSGLVNKIHRVLGNTSRTIWGRDMSNAGLFDSTHPQYYTGSMNTNSAQDMYADSTEAWQLVYFDFSKMGERGKYWGDAAYDGKWNTYSMEFTGYGQSSAVGDTYYIQWAGLFSSIDEVLEYSGEQYGNVITFDSPENAILLKANNGAAPNTKLTYDSENGLITVNALQEKTVNSFSVYMDLGRFKLNSAQYPIVAAKIRAKDVAQTTRSWYDFTSATDRIEEDLRNSPDGTVNGKTNLYVGGSGSYLPTNDWQVVYFDFSKSTFDRNEYYRADTDKDSNYKRVTFSFYRYTFTDYALEDEFEIEWMGVFESMDSPDEYSTGGPLPEGQLFFDLSKPDAMDQVGFAEVFDSEVSYDANEKAIKTVAVEKNGDYKLTTKVAGLSLGKSAGKQIDKLSSTEKYPILAVRVKLGDPDASSGWFYFRTSDGASDYAIVRPKYKETSEWQTVIIDCSKENAMPEYFAGDWTGITMALGADTITDEGDAFYVKWAGVFETIEDVLAYVLKTEGVVETYGDVQEEENDATTVPEITDTNTAVQENEEVDTDMSEPVPEDSTTDTQTTTDTETTTTTTKKSEATKPVKGPKGSVSPLLYVGIGVAAVAIIGLAAWLIIMKKKRVKSEE